MNSKVNKKVKTTSVDPKTEEAKQLPFDMVMKNLSYFYKEAFHYQPAYFIFITTSILVKALQPFLNILLPPLIINELMGEKDIKKIVIIIMAIAIGNVVCNCIASLSTMMLDRYADRFDRYFKIKISEKSMKMDFESTEDPSVLEQSSRAENGMDWYSGGIAGLTTCFMNIISGIITLLGVTAVLLSNSVILLIIIIVSVVIRTMINARVTAISVKHFKGLVSFSRGLGYIFWQLSNFRFGKDIRLYGASEMMLTKADQYNDMQTSKWRNQSMEQTPLSELDAFIGVIADGLKYFYLGYQAIKKIITIGDLTLQVGASGTFDESLRSVIFNVQEINKKSAFMKEYTKFMEYEPSLPSGNKPVPKAEDYQFDFVNVSFKYPRAEQYVLRNVNLTISSKEHLSVVGLNGAGKTTMIKLLCRLYDVTEGEIRLNGTNIKEFDYDEYMKLFSVVFQDFKLFAFSMKENILLSDETEGYLTFWDRKHKKQRKQSKQSQEIKQNHESKRSQEGKRKHPGEMNETGRVQTCSLSDEELLDLCKVSGLERKIEALPKGLETILYKQFVEDGVELSGGEAQKLAIARALYKNAPIVILDEPTAALDPMAEYEIYNHFDSLVGNKTAVYISHRLSSCKFCDRIAVFANETVAEYGTHEELVKIPDGIYAGMFEAQAQYYV